MVQSGFDPRKSAQVAAFFALKNGGVINVLKLMKLMYLSEREYVNRYDLPMLFDKLISMRNGPAMSDTLNFINGEEESGAWSEFVSDRESHDIGVSRRDLTEIDLDELSDSEIEVLNDTWAKFGHLGKWELRDYTHKYCPEWEDPGDSSRIIPYQRLLRYLGRENAERISEEILAMRAMAENLARADNFQSNSENYVSDPVRSGE
ncbi:MAG: Panacea domain-containing protein [Roseiarcus sp.]